MAEQDTSGSDTLAAVANVDVDHLPQLMAAHAAAATLQGQAERVEVTDELSASSAAELLERVTRARRATEAQRVDLVKPLNDTVKKLNTAAKATMAPLEAVENVLKSKLTGWHRQQQEAAQRAQRLLEEEARRRRETEEAERRRVEDAARAAREAAAREAARAEAEVKAAERRRQEQLEREATELERELSAMGDPDLQRLASDLSSDGRERADIAIRILRQRREAREAQERVAAARQAEEDARLREQQARDEPPLPMIAPSAPMAVGPVRSSSGASVGVSQRWTYELEDMRALAKAVAAGEVSVDVLELNRGVVRQMVNDGKRQLAGVRIFQADSASVRLGKG